MNLPRLTTTFLLAIAVAVLGCGGGEGDDLGNDPSSVEESTGDQSLDETEDALRPRSPNTSVSCQIGTLSVRLKSGDTCEMQGCSTGICPGGTVPTCTYGSCSRKKNGVVVTIDAFCTCI